MALKCQLSLKEIKKGNECIKSKTFFFLMPRSVSFISRCNRKLNHNLVTSKNLKDRKELEKQGFLGAKNKILKHVAGKKYCKNLIGFGV